MASVPLTLEDVIDAAAREGSLDGVVKFLSEHSGQLTIGLGKALHDEGKSDLMSNHADTAASAFYLSAMVYTALGELGEALKERFNLAQAKYATATTRQEYADLIEAVTGLMIEAANADDKATYRDSLGLVADCALFAAEAEQGFSTDEGRSWLLMALRFVAYLGDMVGEQDITEAQTARFAYGTALVHDRSSEVPWVKATEEAEVYALMRRLARLADELVPPDYVYPDASTSAFIAKELADLSDEYAKTLGVKNL